MKKLIKAFSYLKISAGIFLIILPFAYLLILNSPTIWYRINPNALKSEIEVITEDPFSQTLGSLEFIPKVFAEAPAKDARLPSSNILKIGAIGVDTEIIESEDEYEALTKGVWRMPDYGNPLSNEKPMVLAAHRWGPTDISAEYRNKNMFLNLPEISKGSEIEVVWEQQIYKFKVTEIKESDKIDKLSDLILLTCKYLNNPTRVIVYAERVK